MCTALLYVCHGAVQKPTHLLQRGSEAHRGGLPQSRSVRGAGKGYGHLPQLAPTPPAGPVGAGVTGTGLGLSACPGTTGQGAHKLPVWGEVRKGGQDWLRDPTNIPDPEISLQQYPTVALQWEMVNNSQVRAETSRFLIFFFQ